MSPFGIGEGAWEMLHDCRSRLAATEAERDSWRERHDTLAGVSRACIASAERERDGWKADALREMRNAADWRARAEQAECALAAAREALEAWIEWDRKHADPAQGPCEERDCPWCRAMALTRAALGSKP